MKIANAIDIIASNQTNQNKFSNIAGCCEAIVLTLQTFVTNNADMAKYITHAVSFLASGSQANHTKFGNICKIKQYIVTALHLFDNTHAEVAKWESNAITQLITGSRLNKEKF